MSTLLVFYLSKVSSERCYSYQVFQICFWSTYFNFGFPLAFTLPRDCQESLYVGCQARQMILFETDLQCFAAFDWPFSENGQSRFVPPFQCHPVSAFLFLFCF